MTSNQQPVYTGRFAPTPSGPLHFGSIIAALASFLDARVNNGRWLLRIDDLDTPRLKPGASDDILKTLELLKLEWDSDIVHQSARLDAYQLALNSLSDGGLVYKCYCSRKQTSGMIYPGTCRDFIGTVKKQFALRIRTTIDPVGFTDHIQGDCYQDLLHETGDFIVRRADMLFAYHLAVSVDDAWQGITHIIRGADLLDSTPKQIYLQSLLGLPVPDYGHVPVAIDRNGKKISKRDGAVAALLTRQASKLLVDALLFLGQPVEPGLAKADTATVVSWAIDNWDISRVPKLHSIKI